MAPVEAAASILGISQSTLTRLETCKSPLARNDLNRYLELLVEANRAQKWGS